MILIEIKEALSLGNKKEYKKFGILMGVVFTLISSLLFWNEYSGAIYYLSTGVIFAAIALISPVLLKYLYNIWMTFAAIMGYIMSRLILSLIFIIMFTPVGLITRLIRKDLLKMKWDKGAKSYWIIRDNKAFTPKSVENQY